MTGDGTTFERRLEERVREAGLTISLADAVRFARYFELLRLWNAKVNLTALPLQHAPASSVDRLFVEPLIAAGLVENAHLTWFDLGSGGGSPAIPLNIVRPALRLTMVDSVSRKTAFLREAARTTGLDDARVLTARIENLGASHAGTADFVTVRAVRFDDRLSGAVQGLLKQDGRVLRFGAEGAPIPPGFSVVSSRPFRDGSGAATLLEKR